ncbi:MAG: hypothetical protein KJ583_02550 [Nanoarchaeota archaeon]|nr:hypothetical protein [Nanoarchaeota archaeon]MBU1269933.1 hypothetical protein [Nanoarchaeota archaeon]MBU1604174.1 hypothetical protein [Nanoarchaeota archaeon]MBU2443075.1 hypothetical protein [Nanoarchaeota archaeon]
MYKKGEISTSTMIYIGLGLLVLILGAIMISKAYRNSQQVNSNCGLVDKNSKCQPQKCPEDQSAIGFCPDKSSSPEEKYYCCKTSG